MKTNKTPKIEALLGQVKSGNLKSNNSKILNHIILKQGSSIEKMRIELLIPHQTLTSSISHLVDMGAIYVSRIVKGENRNYSFYEFESLPMLQEINKTEQRELKFIAIKKRLLTDFSDLMNEELINELNN